MFFCTSWGEFIVLIDCDKAFDWLTTSRDVNAEFKGIDLLLNYVTRYQSRVQGDRSVACKVSLYLTNPPSPFSIRLK